MGTQLPHRQFGGLALLDMQLADAVDTGESNGTHDGAGIILDEGAFSTPASTAHSTLFAVSTDREKAIVVACNLSEVVVNATADELAELWDLLA